MSSRWFRKLDASKPLRLLCFPHAGGGVVLYRAFAAGLPGIDVVPVQLPGRDGRRSEPAFTRMPALIDAAEAGLREAFDRPVVLFGHSMGALVAFELARRLDVQHLFVSSRRAPHLPDLEGPIHHLPEPSFLSELQRRFGALPKVLLDEPELLRHFLPVLRADYAKLDTYRYVAGDRLDVPITAVWGTGDGQLAADRVEAWAEHTTGPFTARPVAGGHFYFKTDASDVLRIVREAVDP